MVSIEKALEVLSKSSAYSVSTITDRRDDELDELKAWLFVEQKIETDLHKFLENIDNNCIVFLCGSSGDGKSEILTRCSKKYGNRFKFHLDATHSFLPYGSAIQTLDNTFDQFSVEKKSLIIGINIGMLANYAHEGADHHHSIKAAIAKYLKDDFSSGMSPFSCDNIHFFDFEKYPRFDFASSSGSYSWFIKEILKKLTSNDAQNPFYKILISSHNPSDAQKKIIANFKLLSRNSVQDAIITQLFKARLIKDQFVTTRALLDLIHHLLLGPKYLFDNLYEGDDNELVSNFIDFDPSKFHTKELDQFILSYELGLHSDELIQFLNEIAHEGIYINRSTHQDYGAAASLIRLFSLLKDESLSNNFHKALERNFDEMILKEYSKFWLLHKNFDKSDEQKRKLRDFYNNILINGIYKYANRNLTEMLGSKEELLVGLFKASKITARLDIKPDYEEVFMSKNRLTFAINAHLKVDNKPLKPMPISFALFDMLKKLENGYRPNKYDKNSVVILEEIVEQVVDIAKTSSELKFYTGHKIFKAKYDDELITVSEER